MSNTASKTTKTVVPSKTTTFEGTEALMEAMPTDQGKIVRLWCATNKGVRVGPIAAQVGEGNLPVYLSRHNTQRAEIVRMMVKGMSVELFLKQAAPLGGGYTDLIAGLLGGYSPSSKTWGTPAFTLTAVA